MTIAFPKKVTAALFKGGGHNVLRLPAKVGHLLDV
jgi:hypothetical protein